MKIKQDYIVREIIDTNVMIPVGSSVIDFKGIMTLSSSAAFICTLMEQDVSYQEVLDVLLEKYDVEEAQARKDLDEFLDTARELGVLEA